jgi:hypothetical protein
MPLSQLDGLHQLKHLDLRAASYGHEDPTLRLDTRTVLPALERLSLRLSFEGDSTAAQFPRLRHFDTCWVGVPAWVAAVTTLSLDNDLVDYDDDGAAPVDLTGLTGLLHLRVLRMDERGFPTGLPASLRTVTTTGQSIDPSQIARLAARLPKLQAIHTTSGVTEQQVAAARAAGIRLHAHEPRGEFGEFGEFSRGRKRQAGDVVPGLMSPRNPRHPLRALRVEVPAAFVNTTAMKHGIIS